eukprot:3872141-Amphidinium_carterae.1
MSGLRCLNANTGSGSFCGILMRRLSRGMVVGLIECLESSARVKEKDQSGLERTFSCECVSDLCKLVAEGQDFAQAQE